MQSWRQMAKILPRAAPMTLARQATPMPLLKTMRMATVATRAMTTESLARDDQRKDEESGGKFPSQLMD